MTNIWDYINSINDNKTDLTSSILEGNDYSQFMVNRAMSYFPDTLLFAHELNCRRMDNDMHYAYLLNNVRRKKRFSKWHKKSKSDDLEAIMEYYGFSRRKAIDALKLLNEEQLSTIRKRINKGGRDAGA